MPILSQTQTTSIRSSPSAITGKRLAALLLAAIASALIVLADSVVGPYTEGHLLLGWVSLWVVGFATLALFAGFARRAAASLMAYWGGTRQRRVQRRSDEYLMALAEHDPRIMEEVQAAMQRAACAEREVEAAWMERHPVGTFNAAYQGRARRYRVMPLAGLPAYMQYLPG
ncbi:MAG: hypothetical protein ABI343_15920 [Burkholderiaceae bacterium]